MSEPLSLVRGDSAYLDLVVTDRGEPVDLSVVELWWTAKHRLADEDDRAVIRKTRAGGGIVVTDALNGAATVIIDADDWGAYTGTGPLVWDLQMKVPSSPTPLVVTVAQGKVQVTQDVTRDDG